MKEAYPSFQPPISIVQALVHKTSVQLGPALCAGWSFPALKMTARDDKKLDHIAANLAPWRSPDAPRSVIAALDSFPAQVLLIAGHSRILGMLIAQTGLPLTKEGHESLLALECFVEKLLCSWKGVSDTSFRDNGGFDKRKSLNLEGKIDTGRHLCDPCYADHTEGERESALSFRGGLFAVFCAASSCYVESSIAEGIMHSIIPYVAECSSSNTLPSPSIAGYTFSDTSWINTLRFQELLAQTSTCTLAFLPSPELNSGVTLPSSAVVSLRLLLEGFERGIINEDNLSLVPPSVLLNLEQLLLHPSIQKALWWAEEDKVNRLSKALMGRSWDSIQLALDTVRAAALLYDDEIENATTETSVVYSQDHIQAVLRFLCSVTDERIVQRLLTACPNILLELIVRCGPSTRKAALATTMNRMDSDLSCSLSDDILSALLLGALCGDEECAEIVKNHKKSLPSLISCADLWARGDEKVLLEIIHTIDHPMPLFRALTSCFKLVRDTALARWREKGVELSEWFQSSYVSNAGGKADLGFFPPLPLSPHCLSAEQVVDLISLMEHSSGVEEKLAAEHLCLALCSVSELGNEIVEWAVDVALQRICCGGDDNFPEHCLEVFWYAVSRQPWAAKYVIGNDAIRLVRLVSFITKHPRNSSWKLTRDILTWLSFCPASLGPWEPYHKHLGTAWNALPILYVPEFCLQYHNILFLAEGKVGDKGAIVRSHNMESWIEQARPFSDVYEAETRRIQALWKERQAPGFKWFQPEALASYSQKQLRDACSHSSFSRSITFTRQCMLYNPVTFSRAFLRRGEWYTALGRLLRSPPVTKKDHKVLKEGVTLMHLLFTSATSVISDNDGHEEHHIITHAIPLLVTAIRECFSTLLQFCGCVYESSATRIVLLFLLKLCSICHQDQENSTAEVLAQEILPNLDISLSCFKCKESSELSWIRLELVSRLFHFAKGNSNCGIRYSISIICTSLPATSFIGSCTLLASLRCINAHLVREGGGGATETIVDEAALRGIVCCTIHCRSKVRIMAFEVLSRMPSHILARSSQPGGPLSLRELCYRVCGSDCLATTVSIANLIWRILCAMEKSEKESLTAVIYIMTDALSRDLVHVHIPGACCAMLRVLSRALLVHSVEEQHSGSQCDCIAVRESGCLESCIRLAAGIENSQNSIRLQAAWLVRVFSATSCVEGSSMEILKPYASAIYESIVHERSSGDALKASLCAIAAQLVTECPYDDCIVLLDAASHLLSGRGGVLDLEECLGPLRLAAAILENSAPGLYKKIILQGALSVMTDLYSLPAFQDESLLIFCICRVLLLMNMGEESDSLSQVRRYERSLLTQAVKAWSSRSGLHAAVGPAQDVISLISCLVYRSPRMQIAAVKAGVPKLCEAVSARQKEDLIVPFLHLACNLCADNNNVKVALLRSRSHMPSSILALAINACAGALDGTDEETDEASFALLQNTASSYCTISLLTHQSGSSGLETCLRQVAEYGSLPAHRKSRAQEMRRLGGALMVCAAAATHRHGAVAIPQSFYFEVPKIFCNDTDRGVIYAACNLLRNTITVIGRSAVPSNILEALVWHVKQVLQVSGEEIGSDSIIAPTRSRAMVHLDSCLSLLDHM